MSGDANDFSGFHGGLDNGGFLSFDFWLADDWWGMMSERISKLS